jgi:predicted dehydrogenase
VLIATPPALHADLALAALRAGKHVVVEKPPFLHSTDFAPVEAAARAAGRRLLVAENYHYKPLARTLRRLLADGVVGEVLFLHVNALKRQVASGWRAEPELSGGGALFEGGIHWVSFMAHLGLAVREVRGFAPASAGVERGVVAVFQYEGGAVGTLFHSWAVPSSFGGVRGSRIYGREGTIAFESNGLAVAVWGRRKRLIFPGVRDLVGRRAMWRDFARTLREGAEPEYDLALARRDLELVERIVGTPA